MTFAAHISEVLNIPALTKLEDESFMPTTQWLRDNRHMSPAAKKACADYFGLPLATVPTAEEVDKALLPPLPLHIAKAHLFLPIHQKDGHITCAIAKPLEAMMLADDYAQVMKAPVRLVYMDANDLTELINKVWDAQTQSATDVAKGVEEETEGEAALQSMADGLAGTTDLLDEQNAAPIIRLINSTLSQAVKEGASDIHIEPFEKQVTVRFRVDGVMHTVITPSRRLHAAMSARIKIMAGLDIAEKRLPQDGRFKIKLAGKETDIRISTLPTQHGERIVMRLLGREDGVRKLEDVGLRPEQAENIKNLLSEPNGMFYICGPTGSGKTTTLYAGLNHINQPDKNIVTVEDPVEYQLDGIGQIHVNSKIGLTFSAGLRSILRQDPDVVVVGETRDKETAQIAIESSLTGHLVLSTIHTNDAPGTITRLLEMGIEPFLVASSLRAVLAQRMIRLLNPTTKKPIKQTPETIKIFEDLPTEIRPDKIMLFEAAPSADCPTGYKGRTGIFELLTITDNVRTHITNNDEEKVRETAQKEGMLTLYQEGLLKAARGETTLEEVMRVTRMS